MTRAMAAGALVCALLLTSACGGDSSSSEGTPSPSPTSASPSASAPPSAPALPEAAKKDTKAGAIAFVRYYVELINHAQATGETSAMSAASHSRCKSCQDAIAGVKELYGSGGSIEGGDWQIKGALAERSAGNWLVTVRVSFSAQVVHRPGHEPEEFEAGQRTMNFTVQAQADGRVLRWTSAS